MNIVDRINQQAMQVSANAKMGVQSLLLRFSKLVTGLLLGLTFSLAGQEAYHFGPLLFWFVIIAIGAVFLKLSRNWGGIGLLIFDLLCILAALLIRMYVVVAPG